MSFTAVFRKSDPGNSLIVGSESDPKSRRAQFKLILENYPYHLYRNFIKKKKN